MLRWADLLFYFLEIVLFLVYRPPLVACRIVGVANNANNAIILNDQTVEDLSPYHIYNYSVFCYMVNTLIMFYKIF